MLAEVPCVLIILIEEAITDILIIITLITDNRFDCIIAIPQPLDFYTLIIVNYPSPLIQVLLVESKRSFITSFGHPCRMGTAKKAYARRHRAQMKKFKRSPEQREKTAGTVTAGLARTAFKTSETLKSPLEPTTTFSVPSFQVVPLSHSKAKNQCRTVGLLDYRYQESLELCKELDVKGTNALPQELGAPLINYPCPLNQAYSISTTMFYSLYFVLSVFNIRSQFLIILNHATSLLLFPLLDHIRRTQLLVYCRVKSQ
jgi:hypothetical protein